MATAFVDMVGLLMVLPLLPFYAKRLGAGGLVVGFLVSSFAVAQLLSAPLWGRFSDRFGRRPALLVALGSSAVAYVIFAYANSLVLLFASRLVQGAGGGTVGVIQAYVADATEPKDRAKSLGWLSAATNLGVALGPVLGSLAVAFGRHSVDVGGRALSLGPAAPGVLAALLCLVNLLFARRYLSESRHVPAPAADGVASAARPTRGTSRGAVLRVLTHSGEASSRLIWIYAIAMGAFQGSNAILALFLASRFQVTEATIGWFFTYVGVISVLTRALLLGKMVDAFGEARLSRLGSTLLALGLAGIPLVSRVGWLALPVAFLPLGTAFTFPCVTALLSRVIPSHERGLYMGVQQTFGGVARVLFPVGAGWLFDHLGVGAPFLVSAALVLGTIALGVGLTERGAAGVRV
jgi:MFS family permease